MKESKSSEKIEQNELAEKIFEEDLKEIKEKLNAEKLTDEFKENLQAKLEEELNKTTPNKKGKIIKFPTITRKLAGICACFVFLCSGCIAFADDIENVILDIFCNTDRIIEKAIANGNYKEIDMDYIESNGVSIKVDYIAAEDENLYIAFNVLSEEEFDNVVIDGIKIKEQNDVELYSKIATEEPYTVICENNRISSKNSVIVYKLIGKKIDFNEISSLNIEISKFDFIHDNEVVYKNGLWKFEVNK